MNLSDKDTSSSGVTVSSRFVSWCIAFVCMLVGVTFVVGYFVGKKKALGALSQSITQDSLSDRIHYSMSQIAPADDTYVAQDQSIEESELVQEQQMQQAQEPQQEIAVIQDADVQFSEEKKQTAVGTVQQEQQQYYAQLIGFGKKRSAQKCVTKFRKKEYPVKLIERESSSAQGAKKVWYQVVTERFADKQKLQELVDTLSKKEKITGARIVACS